MPGKASSKPAGKFKVSGGSGKMHGFKGTGTQTPGQTATKAGGGGGKFAKGGGSGKMHKFDGVRAQKSGRTGQA